MLVHRIVDDVVTTYMNAMDIEAPGFLEGLYLTGSAALGDFRPRASDIDFVAVTATRPEASAIAALKRVHDRLRRRRPRPCFDGIYVTWDDLADDPADAGRSPYSHEGRFHARSLGCIGDPVTWHTLARYAITCRGCNPADLNIWADPAALTAWTLDNLTRYWELLLDRATRVVSSWGLAAFTSYGAVWIVLGIGRLHYTLATGDISSKEGTGRYALEALPDRWHRVLNEGLRIRSADYARPGFSSVLAAMNDFLPIRSERRSLYETPLARRRDVLAFGHMILTDARRRFGGHSE